MRYRGYTGVAEYDPRTESFHGHVIEIEDNVGFEAVTTQRLSREFRKAVDQYIDSMRSCEEEPEVPRRDSDTSVAAEEVTLEAEAPNEAETAEEGSIMEPEPEAESEPEPEAEPDVELEPVLQEAVA